MKVFTLISKLWVVFCGRNVESGEKIAAENNALFMKADVTNHLEVEAFFTQIKEKFGRLDVLINNAGIVSNIGRQ